jgi:hypothetical protein
VIIATDQLSNRARLNGDWVCGCYQVAANGAPQLCSHRADEAALWPATQLSGYLRDEVKHAHNLAHQVARVVAAGAN